MQQQGAGHGQGGFSRTSYRARGGAAAGGVARKPAEGPMARPGASSGQSGARGTVAVLALALVLIALVLGAGVLVVVTFGVIHALAG